MSTIKTLGPVGFNLMGEYSGTTQYHRLDVVIYNGVSYAAIQDTLGQVPTNTTYWDALGISGADMTNYYTKTEIDTALNAKYTKPDGGIPKNDLDSSVQTSLGLADTSIQSHQDISGKEDKTNKVTSINSSSTDTEYPSAKCVYDIVGDINDALNAINGESV